MKTIRKSNILGIGYFSLQQVQGAPPLKGQAPYDYQDTTVFGEGSIQHDRAARFTGKPYDKEMGAYIFPYRNYDPITMRWRSADPSGYPDGVNNQFYACVPTMSIDPWGLEVISTAYGDFLFSYTINWDVTFDECEYKGTEMNGLTNLSLALAGFDYTLTKDIPSKPTYNDVTLDNGKIERTWTAETYINVLFEFHLIDIGIVEGITWDFNYPATDIQTFKIEQ